MLTRPTPLALKALYSFSNHTGWGEVSKWLDAELQRTHETLAMAQDEVTMRQLQGRAQFLTEFQATVRDAPKLLAKLRESPL